LCRDRFPSQSTPPGICGFQQTRYGTDPPMSNIQYKTTELELASFLKARGERLLRAQLKGRVVEFIFPASSESAIEDYFAGAQLSARELFEAHRSLRALIQQVREHQSQIGTETYGTNSGTDNK
jgi:hypothetical protein